MCQFFLLCCSSSTRLSRFNHNRYRCAGIGGLWGHLEALGYLHLAIIPALSQEFHHQSLNVGLAGGEFPPKGCSSPPYMWRLLGPCFPGGTSACGSPAPHCVPGVQHCSSEVFSLQHIPQSAFLCSFMPISYLLRNEMCLLTLGHGEANACCTAVIQATGMGMQLPVPLTL